MASIFNKMLKTQKFFYCKVALQANISNFKFIAVFRSPLSFTISGFLFVLMCHFGGNA